MSEGKMHAISGAGRPVVPRCWSIVEIDAPEPGPGEVAIQVGAAGVNFIDIYHRQGVYPMPLPFVPGREGAGRVIAIGPDVDRRRGRRPGGLAAGPRARTPRSSVGPAEKLIPVPDALSDEQAAALALQGLTAQSLATDVYRIESGDTVLIHAGAGGVGLLLTQIAKAKGARVITTVSTPDKAELSRAAGADDVLIGYDGFPAAGQGSHRRRGCRRGLRRGGQGDLRRLARRAAGPRDHGAVRRGQRPGAAVRHPAAEPGRVAETDPAERRSLRAGHGTSCWRGPGMSSAGSPTAR